MTSAWLTARIALRNLALRKGRAALMMTGVATGIVTLTLVTATAAGTRRKVEKRIQSFGPEAIMVAAGSPQTRGPGDERVTTLVPGDVAAIRASIPGLRAVVPLVVRGGQAILARDRNTTATVFAATPELEQAWDHRAVSGEIHSESHEASLARVAVLGKTVARELFGADNPVGQSIRINEQKFEIIGVAAPRGTSPMGMDMDNRVYVPLATAMRRLFNVDHYSMVRVLTHGGADMQAIIDQITSLLRQRHSIGPHDTDDFAVRSPVAVRKMAAATSSTLTWLLGIITFVALAAGALVLANILSVAVAERRVEIGVRRAVGASKSRIAQEFLIEGVVVTLVGGLVGIATGVLAALLLRAVTSLDLALGWQPIVLGLVVSMAVGLIASFVPARRAASTDVVAALRP